MIRLGTEVSIDPDVAGVSAELPMRVADNYKSAGTFKLTLQFTEEYPNKAPVVKFKSHMFHPNSE